MKQPPYTVIEGFRKLFQSVEAHGIVLTAALNYLYADEEGWFDFDPITIYMDLKDILSIDPATEVMDRIGAVQVVMVHGRVFEDPSVFIAVAETLTDGGTLFGVVQDITVEECAWCLMELAMLRDMPVVGYHIKQLFRNLLQAEGYTTPPEVFQIVLDDDGENDNVELIEVANDIHAEGNIVNASTLELFIRENIDEVIEQFDSIPVLLPAKDQILNPQTEPVA